jgi:hypothetical protein
MLRVIFITMWAFWLAGIAAAVNLVGTYCFDRWRG